jgi:hypothetical protein
MVDYLVKLETEDAIKFVGNNLSSLGIPLTSHDVDSLVMERIVVIDTDNGYVGLGLPDNDQPLVRGSRENAIKLRKSIERYSGEKVWGTSVVPEITGWHYITVTLR